ncbi:TetR/AcrR family transcriptional regulator [Dactylosporangium sp. CA-139114]|uniref:TetR/AcrR family transcriptional regulator n=1 Tax=Dactylosporangium sp. CA-139114 TaxID=3239931 RepID=UPI003D96B575
MTRGTTGNARGELARARLLDAALQSFARRGFHGTGTRDIAEAAGMSPAAVYVHYRTKEELLFELSLAGHRQVRQVMDEALTGSSAEAGPADPARRLRDVVRAFTSWHARAQIHARVVQYEMAALSPQHATEIAGLRREIESLMRRLVTDGRDAGVFGVANPRLAALAILSLGIDVARWYRPDGAWGPDEIGAQYGDLALDLVRWTRAG